MKMTPRGDFEKASKITTDTDQFRNPYLRSDGGKPNNPKPRPKPRTEKIHKEDSIQLAAQEIISEIDELSKSQDSNNDVRMAYKKNKKPGQPMTERH